MPTLAMKPFHLFFPITRVNEDDRSIDAYAFCNEVVDGEGGIRLKRSAMEDATAGYMEWANVRRMHQPDAVGIAKSVEWDDKGARMTLEVVDDDAWEKVKRGVYKGLSVGVAGTVMRGKDVEKCRWIETSLVDRPKDPDAKIMTFRADDLAETYEVEIEEGWADGTPGPMVERVDEPDPAVVTEADPPVDAAAPSVPNLTEATVGGEAAAPGIEIAPATETRTEIADLVDQLVPESERGITSDTAPARENLEGAVTHYSCGSQWGCCGHTTPGGAQECNERRGNGITEQIQMLKGELSKLKAIRAADPEMTRADGDDETDPEDAEESDVHLQRLEDLSNLNGTLTERAEVAESDLARVQSVLSETSEELRLAKERVTTLERQPDRSRMPLRFVDGIDRTFWENHRELPQNQQAEMIVRLQAEYTDLNRNLQPDKEPDARKRAEGVVQIGVLKRQIMALGGQVPA